jgi:DNA polymerase-3 subunit gamma/tau
MALDDGALAPADDFVSLYRRYRPGKFSELRGQEHVVKALRSAVRDGHVAHAYLFSGPRGTGKTSTARILAKALNCLSPVDGEPCGSCASCLEITKGTSMDVTELDAASNNGVDAIRDLIAHAALGSPGRSKVYIIDEVHMLSTAAANALLKTLEEPPSHVVFVLATTDPQKVPPTIRSRTQHLEFRLLGAETLEGLLRDVRDDAGLPLDDEVVSLAVRKGRGSARDALSALDQVAASGEALESRPGLTEVIEGLCDEEAGRALVALAELHGSGWGPQQLCGELIDDLRQAFLLAVAEQLADVTGADRERLADQGGRLGLARVVRSIELLGRCQVEMRDAPDPQVVLEVAIVRAARSDLDVGTSGLGERLTRLERKVVELASHEPKEAAPGPRALRPSPVVEVPSGSKPSLGAFKRSEASVPSDPKPSAPSEATPAEQETPISQEALDESARSVQRAAGEVSRDDVEQAWRSTVLAQISPMARSRFLGGSIERVEDGVVHVEVPTEPHLKKCLEVRDEVLGSLQRTLGAPLGLELSVAGSKSGASPISAQLPEREHEEDLADLEQLTEAPANALTSVAEARILDAFPGAVEEES